MKSFLKGLNFIGHLETTFYHVKGFVLRSRLTCEADQG